MILIGAFAVTMLLLVLITRWSIHDTERQYREHNERIAEMYREHNERIAEMYRRHRR